jgi:hypothetical protein
MIAAALLLALAQNAGEVAVEVPFAGPRTVRRPQEDPPPAALTAQDFDLKRDDGGFLDLDWLEVQPRIGLSYFTEDWRIDPSFYITVLLHAPLPWLSPASDPGGDYFGLWIEPGLYPNVERTLDPAPDDNSGPVIVAGFGLDYTLLRNQTLYFVLRAGGQYGWFGGIEGLGDGVAPLAGFDFGVHLGSGYTLTLAPTAVFGRGGDHVYSVGLGLVIEF